MNWPGLRVVAALAVMAGACAMEAPERGTAEVERRSHKPVAPVDVRVDSVARAGGWDVTVTATPTRDVDALELAIVAPGVQAAARGFGATRAGETRVLTTFTSSVGEAVGEARVHVGRSERSRAAVVRLGAAPVVRERAIRRVTLPGGVGVAEVRP